MIKLHEQRLLFQRIRNVKFLIHRYHPRLLPDEIGIESVLKKNNNKNALFIYLKLRKVNKYVFRQLHRTISSVEQWRQRSLLTAFQVVNAPPVRQQRAACSVQRVGASSRVPGESISIPFTHLLYQQ